MIYLERHEPEDNIHRFYALDVSRDLFGLWLLVRRWGRVGRTGRQGGQSLTMSFAARGEAEREQARLLTAKSKRGYR